MFFQLPGVARQKTAQGNLLLLCDLPFSQGCHTLLRIQVVVNVFSKPWPGENYPATWNHIIDVYNASQELKQNALFIFVNLCFCLFLSWGSWVMIEGKFGDPLGVGLQLSSPVPLTNGIKTKFWWKVIKNFKPIQFWLLFLISVWYLWPYKWKLPRYVFWFWRTELQSWS